MLFGLNAYNEDVFAVLTLGGPTTALFILIHILLVPVTLWVLIQAASKKDLSVWQSFLLIIISGVFIAFSLLNYISEFLIAF